MPSVCRKGLLRAFDGQAHEVPQYVGVKRLVIAGFDKLLFEFFIDRANLLKNMEKSLAAIRQVGGCMVLPLS